MSALKKFRRSSWFFEPVTETQTDDDPPDRNPQLTPKFSTDLNQGESPSINPTPPHFSHSQHTNAHLGLPSTKSSNALSSLKCREKETFLLPGESPVSGPSFNNNPFSTDSNSSSTDAYAFPSTEKQKLISSQKLGIKYWRSRFMGILLLPVRTSYCLSRPLLHLKPFQMLLASFLMLVFIAVFSLDQSAKARQVAMFLAKTPEKYTEEWPLIKIEGYDNRFRVIPHNQIQFENMPSTISLDLDETTLLKFCPKSQPEDAQVSLVTHSTVDRSWLIREFCKRWNTAPIVYVLYYDASNENLNYGGSLPSYEECPNLKIILYADAFFVSSMYPVNVVRNMGVRNIETSHYLLVDIDFVASFNLSTELTAVVKSNPPVLQDHQALVIPAFETRKFVCKGNSEKCNRQMVDKYPSMFPEDFQGLQKCADLGMCKVFDGEVNPSGHSTTRTSKWINRPVPVAVAMSKEAGGSGTDEDGANEGKKEEKNGPTIDIEQGVVKPITLKKIECFDSNRYEPYLLLRYCDRLTPLFDERFTGYGMNKISHIQHLRQTGWEFMLPESLFGFVIHFPHEFSQSNLYWKKMGVTNWLFGEERKQMMDFLYKKFSQDVLDAYSEFHSEKITPICAVTNKHKYTFSNPNKDWFKWNKVKTKGNSWITAVPKVAATQAVDVPTVPSPIRPPPPPPISLPTDSTANDPPPVAETKGEENRR